MIYLDNCASTRVTPEVAAAMAAPLGEGLYAHPATEHRAGRRARRAVEEARAAVASAIGAGPEEVFFTSGGTEANNLALLGAARAAGGGHLVSSAVEHSSVLDALTTLEREGFQVTLVPVSEAGLVEPEGFVAALRPETVCASLMYVNNEMGAVEPVAEVGRLLKERRPEVLYHIDAVQAAGKLAIAVDALGADLLTLSAHKLHGPKGVGALYVRRGVRIAPLLYGGGGERGLRPGTENVPGIIGFAAALKQTGPAEGALLAGLRDRLAAGLLTIPGARLNGPLGAGLRELAAPHVISVSIPGVPAARLVAALSEQEVFVSARSACDSRAGTSHVLAAMGLAAELRESAIRLCVSRLNTAEEVARAAEIVAEVVEELRRPYAPT